MPPLFTQCTAASSSAHLACLLNPPCFSFTCITSVVTTHALFHIVSGANKSHTSRPPVDEDYSTAFRHILLTWQVLHFKMSFYYKIGALEIHAGTPCARYTYRQRWSQHSAHELP